MFTNKNKLIAFIALVVVVVLLASTGIALIADNANKKANEEAQARIDAANKAIEDAANKITELENALNNVQSALNSSKSDLEKANDKINELTNSKITIEDWDNATEAAYPAIQKVVKAHRNLLDNVHLYDVEDEEARAALVATSEKATDETIVRILRARTTEEVEELVEDYFETVETLNKNRYDETLAGLIDKAKEDNGPIWDVDYDEVKAAYDYLNRFNEDDNPEIWNAFENYGERNLVEEVDALVKALYDSYIEQLAQKFLDSALPETVIHSSLDEGVSFKTIEDARTAYEALVEGCENGEEEANDIEGVADHLAALVVAEKRVEVLTDAGEAVVAINEQIDALRVVLTVEAKTELTDIKTNIDNWVDAFDIDDDNMGLVHEAAYTTKQGEFDKALAELKTLHDALHTAIDAIKGDVTINSGDAIKAAQDALEALEKVSVSDTDTETLLALDHTLAEDRDAIKAKDTEYVGIVADFSDIRALIVLIYNNTFVHSDLDANLTLLGEKLDKYVDENTDRAAVVALVEATKGEDDEHNYVDLYAKILLFPAKKVAYGTLETIKSEYVLNEGNEEVRERIVKAYEKINGEIFAADTAEKLEAINSQYITDAFEAAKAGTTEGTEK